MTTVYGFALFVFVQTGSIPLAPTAMYQRPDFFVKREACVEALEKVVAGSTGAAFKSPYNPVITAACIPQVKENR